MEPLSTLHYHLHQLAFFAGAFTLWLILYQLNKTALLAKQQPLALLPLPVIRRKRRRFAKARRWIAQALIHSGLVKIPLRRSVVSSWYTSPNTKATRRQS